MSNVDPYLLDKSAQRNFQEETKGKGAGVLCPKKNVLIGKSCSVCTQVAVLFNSGKKDDKDVAFLKMAKPNFYLGCVTRDKPDSYFILEIGKKAGNAILDGVYQKNWVDISHPIAGKGREMMISRSKGSMGFNEYNPSPVLEKADWSIPESVLNNLPNLEKDIINILAEGKYPVKKISELTKETETFTFRICPPWDIQSGNKRFMSVVWRHYGGVTQNEVDGIDNIDLTTDGKITKSTEDQELVPWENQPATIDDVGSSTQHDKCFGLPQFFEADDPTCRACKDYSPCGKTAMKKK